MQPLYAVINSGQLISGNVDLTQRALLGISVPTINSDFLPKQGAGW